MRQDAPTGVTVGSTLMRVSLIGYLLATVLGVVMRWHLTGFSAPIPFDHLLHSHSHTLYFGWAGLAVLGGALGLVDQITRGMRYALAVLLPATAALLPVFLVYGYNPASIAVSTVVTLCWYALIWMWWRSTGRLAGVGVTAIRYGFTYFLIAGLGVWTLAGLQVSGRGTWLSETLAIHAFLLGFGWFLVFGVVGLTVLRADRLGLSLDHSTVLRVCRWWFGLAWLMFPLGVVGGPEVPWLGPAARVVGVLLLFPGVVWVKTLWRAAPRGPAGRGWRAAAVWFALTVAGTAVVAGGGSPMLLAGGRQGVVIYLHSLMVGYVTTSLVLVMGEGVVTLDWHHLSLVTMLAGLGLVMMGWARIGLVVAAWGSLALWLAGVGWARGLLRSDRGRPR